MEGKEEREGRGGREGKRMEKTTAVLSMGNKLKVFSLPDLLPFFTRN